MHTIIPKENGVVHIDGQPFAVGTLKVSYNGNNVVVIDPFGHRERVLNVPYSEIIDPDTGVAFVSAAEMQERFRDNFFEQATGDGGALGMVSAEKFGVRGDGVTNDTAAMQAAVNQAAESGMTLFLGAGTYMVDPVVLPSNCSIKGVSRQTEVRLRAGSASDRQAFSIAGNTSNVFLENLIIDANRAANSGANIVPLKVQDNGTGDPIDSITIKNCVFKGSKDRSLSWFRGFSITNTEITGCSFLDAGVQAIETRGCKFFKFHNNYIYGWGQNNPNAPAFGLQSVTNDYFTITNNFFQNTVGDQFSIESAGAYVQNSVISGNLFDANGLRAGGCSGYFKNTVFSNNRHINGMGSHRTGYEMIGNDIQVVNNYIGNGSIVFTCDDINPVTDLRPNGDTFICTGNDVKTSAANQSCLYISGFTTGGADFAYAKNVTVANNSFDNRGSSGNAAAVSIGFYGSNGYVSGVTIENNHIWAATGQPAVRLRAAATHGVSDDVKIAGNYVYSGLNGVRIDVPASWENVEISGNDFRGLSSSAFVFGSGTFTAQFRVIGNITSDIPYKAFALADGTFILAGTGSPEGVVTSTKKGCIYIDDGGSAGSIVYIKNTASGNTGWEAIASSSGGASLSANQTFSGVNTFSKQILSTDAAGAVIGNSARGPAITNATVMSHSATSDTANILFDGSRPGAPDTSAIRGFVDTSNNFNLRTGNGHIKFLISDTEKSRFWNTGNWHFQPAGGTFTDIASAAIAVNSTTQGALLPRMTTTEKNAISAPAEGLLVYDTTLHKLCVRTASAWETVTSA